MTYFWIQYTLNAARPGESVQLAVTEFLSDEDADSLVSRLEGIPSEILSKLPPDPNRRPSVTDNLLALINRDRTCKVYWNEVNVILKAQAGKSIKAGTPVHSDDITDILDLQFQGIDIPPDSGIMYVFSIGWRRGIYYNFSPLHSESDQLPKNLGAILAQCYARLQYQDLLKISDSDWEELFRRLWFPFKSLGKRLLNDLTSYVQQGWDVDELLPRIHDKVKQRLCDVAPSWQLNPIVAPHYNIIEKAIREFIEEDYVSSISILFPRIEGIMRTYRLHVKSTLSATQKNLVQIAVNQNEKGMNCPLLPVRFASFLEKIYFANFDPNDEFAESLSRNSVTHRTLNPKDFSLKGAILAFMILDQLVFFLRPLEQCTDGELQDESLSTELVERR